MSFLRRIIFWTKEFFFPQVCAICGGSLIGAQETRYGLCEQCRSFFVLTHDKNCDSCGKPLISEKDFCLVCRNGAEKNYDRLWALFPYTGKYRKLLTAYKFEKRLGLAGFLAEKVSEMIAANPVLREAVIVPVPPRPGKIKDTGWDQVDCLVKRLEKMEQGRIQISRCLKRRKSKVQKRLGRADRVKNLHGRILPHGTIPETVLVIDDVITTGTTMEVCSAALKAGGAGKVYGLCLFYN